MYKLLVFFLSFLICFSISAEERQYVRLLKEELNKEPIALQTSIEHLILSPKDCRRVDCNKKLVLDLVSAVHIAEKSYYQELNKRFKSYDAVLFELVAPSDIDRSQIGKSSDNPLSIAQKSLQSILDLSFQLEEINYQAPNFLHADLSPDEFSESMTKKGESSAQMLLSLMLHSMANSDQRAPANLSDLIMLGFSKTRSIGLRRNLARQFQDMDSMLGAINGAEGSTIVGERNRRAIEVAKNQYSKGKTKLAIFYGGAHMPDMKKQLNQTYSIEDKGNEWLDAWNLRVVLE